MILTAFQQKNARKKMLSTLINSGIAIAAAYIFLHRISSMNFPEASLSTVLLVIIAGYLTAPESLQRSARYYLFLWAGMFSGFFIIGNFIIYRQTAVIHQLLSLSLCVFFILSVLLSCNIIASRFIYDSASRKFLIFFIFIAACAIPLWLGPTITILSDHQSIVDNAISLSPITFIATAINMDYLRSDWFYINTPISGIRYNYPAFSHYIAIQVVILIFIYGLIFILNNIHKQTTEGKVT